MAEVTGEQIEALTRAIGGLEEKLSGGGGGQQQGDNSTNTSRLSTQIASAGTGFIGAMATGTQTLSGLAKETGKVMSVLPGLGGALSSLTIETVKSTYNSPSG